MSAFPRLLLPKLKTMTRKLNKLSATLRLVQTEARGTKHYKDEHGNRVILFFDGSYDIEEAS